MNTIVTKILAVVVILVMVGAGVVPVINAINTYTTEETETITFGTNTIHESTVSSVRGEFDGTTFTADPNGAYLQIPWDVMNESAQTYKILNGAVFWAPDTNGAPGVFWAPDTTGMNSAITMTFTQDAEYSNVYVVTATSTDTSLPPLYLPVDVSDTSYDYKTASFIYTDDDQDSYYYVDMNGDLYARGDNVYHQLGIADGAIIADWTKVAENVSSVSSSTRSAFYIATNGDLYATGNNNTGQLGTGDYQNRSTWTKVAENAVKVESEIYQSGNWEATLYLDTNGDLYGTGKGSVIGDGNTYVTTFKKVAQNVTDFCMAPGSSFYLDNSGDLYFTGSNYHGIAGLGDSTTRHTWTLAASNVDSMAVNTGNPIYDAYTAYYVATNGDLYASGSNSSGQYGNGTTTNSESWTKVAENVSAVYPEYAEYQNAYTFYIATNGDLYVSGFNSYGRFGDGSNPGTSVLTWTKSAENAKTVFVTNSKYGSYYLDTSNNLYFTGDSSFTNTITINEWSNYPGAGIMATYRMYLNAPFGYLNTAFSGSWETEAITIHTEYYTNTVETVATSDVRGSIEGTTFTADPDGDYLMVISKNLPLYSYQIGKGETYYTANGTTVTAFEAPSTTGVTDATLTFTQNSTDSNVYDVTGTTVGASYGVVVPYTVTYDITHTVTHERLPMMNLIPLILIIMSVLFVAASLIIDRRGY